jgi:hypothetical protein
MVYNVENLFDIDGVSVFQDYQLGEGDRFYSPRKLLTKLQNIRSVIAHFNEGRGPEVILFNEFEVPNTPGGSITDYQAFLDANRGTTVEELLTGQVPDRVRTWPAEAWLLKALDDAGLGGYFVATGETRPEIAGRPLAQRNVTFSRFPIVEVIAHPTVGARAIVETKLDVDGHMFYVFNNHWKSGASNPQEEQTRLNNARTLRDRVDQILTADPNADIILGGDFNSLYNQSTVFSRDVMPVTALNDVLGSQGDEQATASANGPALYNLWYELPFNQRGSDHFRGEWGTLMMMILSRGLYDYRGVQYIDNSFFVGRIPGKNSCVVTGVPMRWTNAGETGGGFSDHFPILARFRTVEDNDPSRFITTASPYTPSPARRVPIAAFSNLSRAERITDLPPGTVLRSPDLIGRVFLVEGRVTGERPFRIDVRGEEFEVFSHDANLRTAFWRAYKVGDPVRFHGRLGMYQGRWQFVIEENGWWRRP